MGAPLHTGAVGARHSLKMTPWPTWRSNPPYRCSAPWALPYTGAVGAAVGAPLHTGAVGAAVGAPLHTGAVGAAVGAPLHTGAVGAAVGARHPSENDPMADLA